MVAKATLTSKPGKLGSISAATKLLTSTRVLIGIPGDADPRRPEPGEKTPPSNAVIGFVQEWGDDELHIPPRPFLVPGAMDAKADTAKALGGALDGALTGSTAKIQAVFSKVGQINASAVQAKITSGPFVPLSQRTIEERARRGRKGAKQYLKLQSQGTPREVLDNLGDQALVKPLIDTGALRRSITYIVKDRNI